MSVDQDLNKILKEMWRLDEQISNTEIITEDEKIFYNQNLMVIKAYYSKNDAYWQNKKII